MKPRAGVILGARYELVAALGKGGMGEVWRAQALDLDAPVAAALRSPHVVQVLGYGLDEPRGVRRLHPGAAGRT